MVFEWRFFVLAGNSNYLKIWHSDNTTELWMTKYIIGEIFSSGGATLYKNPSDQTVEHESAVKIETETEICLEKSLYLHHWHSLIKGVLIQSCSAGAKNFTNYVFCHVQFNSPGQSSKNHCAIKAKF